MAHRARYQALSAALGLSLLPASARAGDWGELWGSLIWGDPAAVPVPLLDSWGLLMLGIALGVVASRALQRGHARTVALGFAALVALSPVALRALTLPHTFSNGTVADADEVNANFAALETSLESGTEVSKWGWQAVHAAAAAACRGSTATGGSGAALNVVRVRDRNAGLSCNTICNNNFEACDAEVSIIGHPRQGLANGEAVGSFYNYSCGASATGGNEPAVTEAAIGNPATGGSTVYSYCCCRQP